MPNLPAGSNSKTSATIPGANLRHKFIVGTAWMAGLRWSLKLLGLISTLIVARLLVPHDYGLVSMAIMASAFVEVWLDFGVRQALIHNQEATREDYDTAWSLRIIQGACIALTLVAGSGLIAGFFNEPRLISLIWLISGGIILTSVSNIGIVDFQKEMNFRREFMLEISSKLISTAITIVLAVWLRNYWALAIGIFAKQLAYFILSYLLHSYRPHWSLSKFRSLWSFSQWMLISNIGTQFANRSDQIIVGKLAAASGLGIYTVALELAQIATNELTNPLAKTLLPLMAQVKGDKQKLLNIFLKVMGSTNTLTIPAGIGLALIAKPFILVLLGEKWLEAVPYVQIFSIYGLVSLALAGSNSVLIATGRVRLLSSLVWLEGLFLVVFSLIGFEWIGMIGIAYARIVTALVYAVVVYVYLAKHINLTLRALFGQFWRPLLSSGAMALTLWGTPTELLRSPLLVLICSILLGGMSYAISSYFLWMLSGRPDGVERMVVASLKRLYAMAKLRGFKS
jgi:lipopolysaccharide exporter